MTSEPESRKRSAQATRLIGLGLAIGAAMGVIFDNIAVGVGLCVALGLIAGVIVDRKNRRKNSAE